MHDAKFNKVTQKVPIHVEDSVYCIHVSLHVRLFDKLICDTKFKPLSARTDHDQQHCYHHVPTVNQRLLLLQLIGS